MKEQISGKAVYLSGAITSDPEYRRKFRDAVIGLHESGARKVFNPADLLPGGSITSTCSTAC